MLKQDKRHKNKGRPKLPEGLKRKMFCCQLPLVTIEKIKGLAERYKSQSNVIAEAIDRLKE